MLQADLATGALLSSDGRRCAALSVDFIQSLHFTLLEQFGDAAQDVLYRSGYEWGLQMMVRLHQELQDTGAGSRSEWSNLEPAGLLAAWWQPLQEAGWGAASMDLSRRERQIVVVELQHSAIAAALEGTDQPVCHFYAGLFGSAVSFLDRSERHVAEIECFALGHPRCRFVVGPGSEIDAAEAARQQGVPPAEIIRRFS